MIVGASGLWLCSEGALLQCFNEPVISPYKRCPRATGVAALPACAFSQAAGSNTLFS